MSDEKRLIKTLLDHYKVAGLIGRPVDNTSETVTVSFGLALIQLLELDEKKQVLTTNAWFRYAWKDSLLRWNPEDFDGVNHVRLPASQIWTPDVILYNHADDRLKEKRDAMAVVSHTGDILYIPMAIQKSMCSVDLTNFPYDTQTCRLKFGSWTYDGFRLDLTFFDDMEAVDLNDYVESNHWKVLSAPAQKNVKHYPCCLEPYPDLTFTVVLQRNASLYNATLVLPCVLLSLMVLLMFLLPPDSGGRLALGLTLFVVFFLLLVLLDVPSPASPPRIASYFCFNLIMIFLAMFVYVFVKYLHNPDNNKGQMPRWMKKIFVDLLARSMGVNVNRAEMSGRQTPLEANQKTELISSAEGINNSPPGSQAEGSGLREIRDILETVAGRMNDNMERDKSKSEWRIMARVIDRFFFFVYLAVIVIVTAVIFVKIK